MYKNTLASEYSILLLIPSCTPVLQLGLLPRDFQTKVSVFVFTRLIKSERHLRCDLHETYLILTTIDCSQSPIFPWDRRDVARLTINVGHLDFQMYRGASVGDYRHARWQPVMQSARSRRSYGKTGDCKQSITTTDNADTIGKKQRKVKENRVQRQLE